MKRPSKNSGRWQDHYARQAKKENFPARSVYKLQEIQNRYRVMKTGDRVLDLGCSPGSWMLAASRAVGETGHVVGIDLKPVTVKLPENAEAVVGDIFHWKETFGSDAGRSFDVVISDMAPATTGNRMVDSARSQALCEAALATAEEVLVPGGHFVCKIFQGEDFSGFSEAVRLRFQQRFIFKPRSSRKASVEIYLIGKGKQ